MADDLAAFLTARLNEAEEAADYAGPARIAWLTYQDANGELLYTTVAAGDDYSPWVANGKELPEPAAVRVVHEPARVRVGIAAKRRRLERYTAQPGYDLPEGVQDGRDPDERECDQAVRDALEAEVCEDAAIYSDHPDYRPEWAS